MGNIWYVYVLQNVGKNFIYVGMTRNRDNCVASHRSGFVKSARNYIPLMLKTFIAAPTRKNARMLEK